MAQWLTYLKERFPLPVYFLVVGGISSSGLLIGDGTLSLFPWGLSFLGILLFFALLRLMDELKDYEKDQIAHPDRPLPRGLLQPSEVEGGIFVGEASLLAYSVFIYFQANAIAALSFAVIACYLWLMYREFYLGSWLAERPLLYAMSHQIILLPIALFSVAVARPEWGLSLETWAYGLVILGSFFCYEVCRKLDPTAHPILQTYLQVYGYLKTFGIVVFTCLIAGTGAYLLGYYKFLWPCEGVVLLGFLYTYYQKNSYKITEILASISLLIHLWSGVVNLWI